MPSMYLPVGWRLAGRKFLLVGGGRIAYRKAKTLVKNAADLTVIAPEHNAGIQELANEKLLTIISRAYESPEIENYDLVICATNDETVDQTVYEDCRRAKVPVNVVDDPARCDFIFPALIQRGSLSLAISTDGRAPFLTAFVRRMLNQTFGPQWQPVVDLAESFRAEVYRRFPGDPHKHQECFNKFLATDWPTLFTTQEPAEVEKHYNTLLESL